MNCDTLIRATLASLSLPIAEREYRGMAPVYIVYTCYTQVTAARAGNRTVEREYDFMINIYRQNGNATEINAVKDRAVELLEAAGFDAVSARDRSDLETNYARWLIDCSYLENVQAT